MKTTTQSDLWMAPVSLRSAWRHQPGLGAGLDVAHVALELGLGHERGDGVDHDDLDGAGAHERLGDLEGLLAVIGLRDEQLLDR
jgi:hypothetical protein